VHNEQLHYLYSSSNIIREITSRRMRYAGHVARWGKERCFSGFWWGMLWDGDHLENLGVDKGIIVKRNINK
jgi:hypothetical protein